MSFLKYISRLKKMDDLIARGATGTPKEFAKKLGLSESQLYQELKELRDLGGALKYSIIRRSYYYADNRRLNLNFIQEGKLIRGGQDIRQRSMFLHE